MDKNDETTSLTKISNLERAKEQWLRGEITNDDLVSVIRSKPSYVELQKAGVSEKFDELSQVNCVRELLEEHPVGGDTTEIVRRHAMECWSRIEENIDVAGVFCNLE